MTSTPAKPIVLYWDTLSGHSHRVQLLLNLLRLPHDIRRVQLLKGEHRQPAYLAINPLGQLPAIDDNGTVMADSNAILTYLALTYDPARTWFPADPAQAGEVVRFLSFAAGPVFYSGGEARLVTVFGAKLDPQRAFGIAAKSYPGLEAHLAGRSFLVGQGPTVADVANYTYVAHAPEGGISLEPYANIRAWLGRIEALPHFVPMQRTAVGLQAVA